MKRLFTVLSIVGLMVIAAAPAYADSFDLLPANDGGTCGATVGISPRVLTSEAHTEFASGSANCPGAGQTHVVVCVLMQQPNGDYEQDGGACGAGTSATTASASAEVVCAPGVKYRGTIVATQGSTTGKARTAPVTCPV
jgi:hypothetical protein